MKQTNLKYKLIKVNLLEVYKNQDPCIECYKNDQIYNKMFINFNCISYVEMLRSNLHMLIC